MLSISWSHCIHVSPRNRGRFALRLLLRSWAKVVQWFQNFQWYSIFSSRWRYLRLAYGLVMNSAIWSEQELTLIRERYILLEFYVLVHVLFGEVEPLLATFPRNKRFSTGHTWFKAMSRKNVTSADWCSWSVRFDSQPELHNTLIYATWTTHKEQKETRILFRHSCDEFSGFRDEKIFEPRRLRQQTQYEGQKSGRRVCVSSLFDFLCLWLLSVGGEASS